MAFNFPDSASLNQLYTTDNGTVYRYNGIGWVIDSVSTISTISEQFLSINGDGVISGSSQLTSSFDERYVLSGSITQTTWDNIENKPAGIVSESTDLSSLNGFTSSYFTDSSSFDSRISTEMGRIDSILSASDVDKDSFAEIVSLINSVDTTNDSNFASFYTSSNARIQSLENSTSSFETIGRGIVSGSSQLTSSYDSRYSLSGSVLTSFSSSVDNRLDTLEATIISGSINYTQVLGNKITNITTTGVSIISGSITTSGNPVQVMVTGDANPTVTGWCRLQLYRGENPIGNIIQVENESNQNVPYCLNIIDTPSSGTHTYSMRTVSGIAGTFEFGEAAGPLLTAVELKSNTQLPSGIISGSSQLTSSYDTRYTLSGSVQPLPSGLISGSSQLTASYDTRYTLSGSVVSGTTPAGTVSGSSQLTSSFDGRYVQTGSFNSLTASFNSFTASAQAVTTGSNSFNGTQIITGSLIITTGSFVGSQILANTSSLYLTSGSNMYVQNNGLVEITGSLIATSITGSIAATNGVISGSSQITNLGFVSSSNVVSIQTITSASYAGITPVSGTLYIIIG
jgi:hypothetical protein